MAGIEKICEACDDEDYAYLGWSMYHHKENNIQCHPECRKKFKGKKCVLIFYPDKDKRHPYVLLCPSLNLKNGRKQFWGVLYIDKSIYLDNYGVRNPKRGKIKTVVRKIRKITGAKNLRVLRWDLQFS